MGRTKVKPGSAVRKTFPCCHLTPLARPAGVNRVAHWPRLASPHRTAYTPGGAEKKKNSASKPCAPPHRRSPTLFLHCFHALRHRDPWRATRSSILALRASQVGRGARLAVHLADIAAHGLVQSCVLTAPLPHRRRARDAAAAAQRSQRVHRPHQRKPTHGLSNAAADGGAPASRRPFL